MEEKHWYVIHTYSGYENKVQKNIDRKIHSLNLEDKISRVIIPIAQEMEYSGNKSHFVDRKIFPGYVLLEMVVTDETWYAVRNTPGVTGFVGSGSKPTPLTDKEIKQILRSMDNDEAKQILHSMGLESENEGLRLKINFQIDQTVRIVSGPLKGLDGKIAEINEEKGKLKILVNYFGRNTLAEIDYKQVEEIE